MRLTLSLPAAGGGPDEVRTLDDGTLFIGRGAENGWVLQDPDRTVSKTHCRIDRSEDGFLLTDTSTNGVFLGTEVHPVGRGHSRELVDGDTVVIGPFRIRAAIGPGPDTDDAGADLPVYPEGTAGFAPYDGTVATPGSPITPPPADPWVQALPGGKFGPDLRAGPQGWEAPPDPADLSATGLRDTPEHTDAVAFSGESEHVAATATVMRMPAPQLLLPTDWNDEDPLDGADLMVSLPADAALNGMAAGNGTERRTAEPAAPLPMHEPRDAWPAKPADAGVAAAEGGAARLLSAFLAGAGLPPDALSSAGTEDDLRRLGELVRATVEGMRDLLATRTIVKSELRAEQTVIQAKDNNALKFAPDVQRCLLAMVAQPPAGFLPGPEAMKQGMDDLKRHELALIGALNGVLAEMTAQLDPDAIAAQVRTEAGLGGRVPYAREARCWALYAERYRALQDSGAPNTGGSLVAPVAAAYARHIRRGG